METRLRSFKSDYLPAAILFVLMLGSLSLMSDATQDNVRFHKLYSTLLAINVLMLVLLAWMILANMVKLVRQHRRRIVGSRLAARLVVVFVVLTVAPVSAVFYFSIQFLSQGIDKWFDVQIDKALDDALDLSRSALDLRMREYKKDAETLARELTDVAEPMVPFVLSDYRAESDAIELTLLTLSGKFIASDSIDTSAIIPDRPDEAIIIGLRRGRSYIGLDPIGARGLHIRVVVPVISNDPGRDKYMLQALYPVEARLNDLAASVQEAYAHYQEVVFLREPLKNSFLLTLSLVLLLTLLAAVWAAFISAQRLVAPISVLASGTQAVAQGDYTMQLPLPDSRDELQSLVQSFNDMTRKIAYARDAADHSQMQAENERAYLQGILESLTSGVLTLDRFHVLRKVNPTATRIFGADLSELLDRRIEAMADCYPHLESVVNMIKPHLAGASEWREEITVLGPAGRQVLMFRGKALTGSSGAQTGYVVVFDDVTALIQVERDAAWGEVARRMAHEIKNPLTPIQLSAERMRHKCLPAMEPVSAEILDRATYTIIQQVQAMKEMVKVFSEYARMPKMQLAPLDLNTLVDEVLDLYRDTDLDVRFELSLDSQLPIISADGDRLRQLLHNLIRNALDARREGEMATITLQTRLIQDMVHSFVELRIEDTGTGIPEHMIGKLFEPYVTTKPKGSGLGLAIVKKIVEEHGGLVWAENRLQQGACIVIRLPVPDVEIQGLTAAGKA